MDQPMSSDLVLTSVRLEGVQWIPNPNSENQMDTPIELFVEGGYVGVRKRGGKRQVVGFLPDFAARRVRDAIEGGANIDVELTWGDREAGRVEIDLFAEGREITRGFMIAKARQRAERDNADREREAARIDLEAREADIQARRAARRQTAIQAARRVAAGLQRLLRASMDAAFCVAVLAVVGVRRYWSWIVDRTNR